MSGDVIIADRGKESTVPGSVWRRWVDAQRAFIGMGWIQFQGVLLLVAICVSILNHIFGVPSHFAQTAVFTLCIGNWSASLLTLMGPRCIDQSPPWNWISFIVLSLILGASGSFFAEAVVFGLFTRRYANYLHDALYDSQLGTLITLIFATVGFVFSAQRDKLEKRNRELQSQVQLGYVQEQSHEAELAHAHEIQRHLMPRETPQIPGFQIACAWQPAKAVSGDYFDVFPLGEGRLGLCIADVSGKGIAAALLMANLQASVKALAVQTAGPADFCVKLNRALCETVAPGKFVTLFYGILDSQQRRLQYENAGHCLPLLMRAGGEIELPASYSGVMGLFSHWTYQEIELTLRSGDCLVLMTDGVLEAANSEEEEFGYQRLISVVQRNKGLGADGLRKAILDEVSAFCNGQFQDDASLIVVVAE